MQFTPLQLKEKLLGALDEENNVVNTGVVLEVISILEKFPITREALERTRIGRYVNELRKKTSNEELAKRAKKLVRGWQKLVTVPDGPHTNGDSISTPPQHRNISALQNTGNGSKPSSPAISSPAINKFCVVRSSLSPAIGNRPLTPSQQRTPQTNKLGKAGDLHKSKLSPGLSKSVPSTIKPAVSSPKQTVNVQTSNLSPAVSKTFPPQTKAESSGKNVKLPSPKSRPSTPCQSPSLTCSSQSGVTIGNEDSLSSFPCTPTSVDNLPTGNGHTKRKKRGRKPKSGKKSNHSAESAISPSDVSARSEHCDVPKTDIANRKRVRSDVVSTTPVKQQKLNTSVKSLSCKQPLNGIIYSKSDKTRHNAVNNSFNSDSKTTFSTSTEYSIPGNKKSLTRQDSAKSAGKTPKVKTTAELIADYQQKTGSTSYGNNILEKLRTNQIDHESDVQTSVLPPGIKPRKKRVSNDSSIINVPSPSLSQTKTELVEKFLQTSVSPTSTDLSPPLEDYPLKSESPIPSSQNSVQASTSDLKITIKSIPSVFKDQQTVEKSKPFCANNRSEISEIKHSTGTLESKVEKRLTIDEIYSQLPPIDYDSINWECTEYTVPEPTPVNDSDVVRITSEHWEGINGLYDKDNVWHDWTSTLTLSSVDDEPLHVLPYVDVND